MPHTDRKRKEHQAKRVNSFMLLLSLVLSKSKCTSAFTSSVTNFPKRGNTNHYRNWLKLKEMKVSSMNLRVAHTDVENEANKDELGHERNEAK